jgi:general secretion pathway protein B
VSFILDALDKAEQDRQHTRTPNLKTAHTAVVGPDRFRAGLLITLLVLASTVLVLILYQGRDLIRPQQLDETPMETSDVPGIPPKITRVPEPELPEQAPPLVADSPVNVESSTAPARLQPEIVEPEQPHRQDTVTSSSTEIPNINELPAAVQRQIPNLSFSTHIYASEAAWRMVGINGRSRREGDNIEDGLVLLEITEQGVILEFQGYIFAMGVVRNWTSE